MHPLSTLRSTSSLALAAVLSLGLVGCGDDAGPASSDTASEQPTTDVPTTTEPPTGTGAPSETATSDAPGKVAAPIYFTGDTPLGTRLYREFREVGGDDPLEEAAALLVAGDALDPDYGTLLQGVMIQSVTQEPDAIVVTLGDDSVLTANKGASPKDTALAVQSLVYTLQGVAGDRLPVRVQLADGSPTDLFGQPTADGIDAAPELDVLALVSLTTPEEGVTVTDGTLAVEGVASSFEATVPYSVLDSSGKEVLSDFTTAEQFGDKLYPFSAEVDVSALPPGSYTFVARTDDPSGGEGPGPFEDTKTFTVG